LKDQWSLHPQLGTVYLRPLALQAETQKLVDWVEPARPNKRLTGAEDEQRKKI
jgi:hypothetical protein